MRRNLDRLRYSCQAVRKIQPINRQTTQAVAPLICACDIDATPKALENSAANRHEKTGRHRQSE